MSYRVAAFSVDLAKISAVIGSKDEKLYKRLLAKNRATFKQIDSIDGDDDEEDVVEIDLSKSGQSIGGSLRKKGSRPLKGDPQPGKIGKVRVKPDENNPFFQELVKMFTDRMTEKFPGLNVDDFAGKDEPAEAEDREGDTRPPVSCAEVLRHIIFGEQYDQRAGFKYGYVLEALCEHYGKRLDDAWAPMYQGAKWRKQVTAAFKAAGIPDTLFRSLEKMTERGAPITIPEIDDFPGIGYLKREEMAETRAALSEVNLTAMKDRDVREDLEALLRWFQTCGESQRDLVCFYY
jgi:hypothetical protein